MIISKPGRLNQQNTQEKLMINFTDCMTYNMESESLGSVLGASESRFVLNPIRPRGGHILHAYIHANTYTSALKNLTFLNYEFEKGSILFNPESKQK